MSDDESDQMDSEFAPPLDQPIAQREVYTERTTVCPFCAVGCSLSPGKTSQGRARGIAGPVNSEGRLCQRGIDAFEATADSDRLTSPLVRRNGELISVSWETALEEATARLSEVREEFGTDALCFLGAPHSTNEANYLLEKLARTLGTNNVDNRARLCHASAMTALEERLGRPAMTNSLSGLRTADAYLVIGANPAEQQPIVFNSYVRPAVVDGATLIHVDPRANRTTRLADVHLAPRPGTDALMVELLCALVRNEGLVDRPFVANRTTGYEDYSSSLDALDVESAAARAGLDLAELRRAARLFGSADRGTVLAATGIDNSDPEKTDTADALVNLLLMTGNFGRPGTGMNVFRGIANEQGATDAGCRPDRLPGHQPVSDDVARERIADEWGIEPPATPGLNEYQAVKAFGEHVFGALVVGENPAVEKVEAASISDRLGSLEALVVVDILHNETTAYADVVLPAAAGLETTGTVTNLERRVQQLNRAVERPGKARSDVTIISSLGERLVGSQFEYEDPMAVFEEWTRLSPVHAGLSHDDVADAGVQWPVRDEKSDGTAILYEDSFDTADGRAAFVRVDPVVPAFEADELVLIVGSRAGGFAPDELTDSRLHVNPVDAEARGIEEGETVVVSNDAGTVTTTAAVTDGVREGAVFLHADVADSLVRADDSTVRVRPA